MLRGSPHPAALPQSVLRVLALRPHEEHSPSPGPLPEEAGREPQDPVCRRFPEQGPLLPLPGGKGFPQPLPFCPSRLNNGQEQLPSAVSADSWGPWGRTALSCRDRIGSPTPLAVGAAESSPPWGGCKQAGSLTVSPAARPLQGGPDRGPRMTCPSLSWGRGPRAELFPGPGRKPEFSSPGAIVQLKRRLLAK